MAVEKTLKSARPTVKTSTGKVTRWDVEVTLKDGDFERDYTYSKDVESLEKAPNEFTKANLLSYAPEVLDEVFAHHKLVFSGEYQPETECDNEFCVSDLADAK